MLVDKTPSHVLKAVANIRKDGPAFDIIKKACKELKLKYNSPGIIGDTVVHFTIEKCKLAIIFVSTGPWNKLKVEKIKYAGWIPSVISDIEVIKTGCESIKSQLSDLMKKDYLK